MADTAIIEVHLYDGSRNLIEGDREFLISTRAGGSSPFKSSFVKANPAVLQVRFHDNRDDDYTVLASLKKYEDAGYMPVKVKKNQRHPVHLMLIEREARYDFTSASWEALEVHADLFAFLNSSPDAQARFVELQEGEQNQKCMACLLNIAAAVASLPTAGAPSLLSHFKAIDLIRFDEHLRDGVKPDRFFAWVDPQLVEIAAKSKFFDTANVADHPGATHSFKETRFDEANLQFTFHENTRKRIGALDCIRVEMDMDYYKDAGAHIFLEFLPNLAARKLKIGPGLTDPGMIYTMRWSAGKNATEDFNPLYEIVRSG